MGQKNSKNRKPDFTLISKVNFSEYFPTQNAGISENSSPGLSPSLNHSYSGYIKARPLNYPLNDSKKLSIDSNSLYTSYPTLELNSNSSRTPTFSNNLWTSSIDLQTISRNEVFQIKNVLRTEKFKDVDLKNKQSFFQKLTNKSIDPKISIQDMLKYKPGRRIFFTHTQQPTEMKNPFEEIRVPPLKKKQTCFVDDMALKIEKNDKITPEEMNLPSPYYKIKKRDSMDEKVDNILLNDNDVIIEEETPYSFLAETLLDKVKEANQAGLEGFEKIYEDYENDYRLQIFMKTYVSTEKNRINIFRNQFIVPCSPETFLRFMNNIPEQTKIDTHLNEFYNIKEMKNDSSIIYLSYKKVLISSPRELIYFKVIRNINKEENIWCDASQSVEYPGFEVKKGTVRGEIILSGHMVSPLDEDREKSTVRLYSEVDFKTNVPIFMTKSFSINEMKRYTSECIKQIKSLKNNNNN